VETNNRQLYKLLSCGCTQQVELDFSPTIAYLGIQYHISTSVLSRKLSGFLRPLEDTITSTKLRYSSTQSRHDAKSYAPQSYISSMVDRGQSNQLHLPSPTSSLLQLFYFSRIFPRSLVSIRASLPVREPHASVFDDTAKY